MAPTTARKMRLFVIPITGTATVALISANLAFMVKDAQMTNLALSSFKGSAKGAAILNACSLSAVVILTFTHTLNTQPRRIFQSMLGWLGALIALASIIITVNVLILKKINPKLVDDANRSMRISTEVELAVWAVATVAQLLFYVVFAFVSPPHPSRRNRSIADGSPLSTLEKKRGPPNRPAPPANTLTTVSSNSAQLAVGPMNDKRASWRDSFASLQQIVRPQPLPQQRHLLQQSIDSTNHTARSSLSREESQLPGSGRSNTLDSFSWEYSIPATQTRDTITHAPPVRKGGLLPINGTMLPTIPGSRPTSQGTPLGEPFEMVRPSAASFVSDKSKDSFDIHRPASEASIDKFSLERVRDLSDRPMSALSTTSTITLPDNLPRRPDTSLSTASPEESRPSTVVSNTATSPTTTSFPSRPATSFSSHSSLRQPVLTSRPTTPSVHEAHIHPLFRADSPVPPPAVSANTVITASTFSGQTIGRVVATPPPAQRAHVPFAPGTPPSGFASRSQSRQRNGAASPPPRSSHAGTDTPRRAETPVQRESSNISSTQTSPQGTPKPSMAIPDFILSASNERLL